MVHWRAGAFLIPAGADAWAVMLLDYDTLVYLEVLPRLAGEVWSTSRICAEKFAPMSRYARK